MKTYGRLEIEEAFDKIWETWINQEGKQAARKAVEVFLRSDHDIKDLFKACEIYRLENLGVEPEFTFKLSNFLNQNHWEDVIEGSSLDVLKAMHDSAVHVIEAWNEACKKHWCQSLSIESRVPIVIKALHNKAFRDNWKSALDKASKIFAHEFRDEDPRSKIILSLKWFTNVSPDKHTVLRITEGEYGSPRKETISNVMAKENKEITPEERERVMKDFFDVFKERKTHDKRPRKDVEKIGDRLEEKSNFIDALELFPDTDS